MADQRKMCAFVAGGTGALGAATCRALARAGREVFFTFHGREAAARALAQELGAACRGWAQMQGEALESVGQAFAQAGAIDTLVHAAGPPIPQKYVSATTNDEWRRFVLAELEGFYNVVSVALPALRAAGNSSLIALTSGATVRVIPGDVLSAAPKAAMEMMVRQIAREEGRHGVRANCVAPGIIDAGLGREAQMQFHTPEIWEAQRKGLPLRRFGSAEAVADAACFLAGPEANYITGQIVVVDGGLSV